MLVGTALYVRLMVYMGLSLFIIRQALRIYGCIRIYAYNLTIDHHCKTKTEFFDLLEKDKICCSVLMKYGCNLWIDNISLKRGMNF